MSVWVGAAAAAVIVTILLACLATVATFRFLTGCVARDCRKRTRIAYGVAALASFAGVFVLVTLGFLGASVLLFHG